MLIIFWKIKTKSAEGIITFLWLSFGIKIWTHHQLKCKRLRNSEWWRHLKLYLDNLHDICTDNWDTRASWSNLTMFWWKHANVNTKKEKEKKKRGADKQGKCTQIERPWRSLGVHKHLCEAVKSPSMRMWKLSLFSIKVMNLNEAKGWPEIVNIWELITWSDWTWQVAFKRQV